MSAPLLVTLNGGGYSQKITFRKVRGVRRAFGTIALHCPIGHILGEPDVRILKHSRNSPGVNRKNIAIVLEHETLHHVLQDILSDSNDDTLDGFLDKLPNYHPLRRRLLGTL